MKYIILSFDDARSDTYEVAKPIMEKYGLTGTVNVISDFVLNPGKYQIVTSPKAMTREQVLDWQKWGGEVACHGSTHNNTVDDIKKNIEELQSFGVDVSRIGFASPTSWLTLDNLCESGINELIDNGKLIYLRSGIRVRREGLPYMGLSLIERFTHGQWLYYYLNKRNIIHKSKEYRILPAAAVKDYTSVSQIQYLIEKMKNDEALIIMFHSILKHDNPLYGSDHYYWDARRFDKLCNWLKNNDNIKVINTIDL